MDLSIKTLINLIVIFMGVLLFTSCISFILVATHARSVLYSVTQYVEIFGNDTNTINEYAQKTNTIISITPIDITPVSGYRYQVDVSFTHLMALLNFNKDITYSSMTRIIDY